jgi:energy-coupling factor transporter ATP-binding protein EcfA2
MAKNTKPDTHNSDPDVHVEKKTGHNYWSRDAFFTTRDGRVQYPDFGNDIIDLKSGLAHEEEPGVTKNEPETNTTRKRKMSNVIDLDQIDMKLVGGKALYWVKDPTNQKQARDSGVYIERECGLEPYYSYREDLYEICSELGISSFNERENILRAISQRHMVEEVNVASTHLIQTRSGDVINLDDAYQVFKDKQIRDISKCPEKWMKRCTEYRDNRITLNTAVDYPESRDWRKGKAALDGFLHMALDIPDLIVRTNVVNWIHKYLGRLLIGCDNTKEFVVLLGERDSGKTTFTTMLLDILGSYAAIIPDDVLMSRVMTPIVTNTLYDVKDKRILVHSEGTKKRPVNVQSLKKMTEGTRISLSGTDSRFQISGKLIQDTNYAPVADVEGDEAFTSRICYIPFRRNPNITKAQADEVIKNLMDCKAEIFAYMIQVTPFNMGGTENQRLACTDVISREIQMVRNPVQAFYSTYALLSFLQL